MKIVDTPVCVELVVAELKKSSEEIFSEYYQDYELVKFTVHLHQDLTKSDSFLKYVSLSLRTTKTRKIQMMRHYRLVRPRKDEIRVADLQLKYTITGSALTKIQELFSTRIPESEQNNFLQQVFDKLMETHNGV